MVLKLCVYCILWIILWSLWSLILVVYENIETIEFANIFRLPKCLKCKKKINRKCFLPIVWFLFQKNKCQFCKRRISIIKPILEALTAIIFCLIWYYCSGLSSLAIVFWLLTSRILLLVSICDIIRYEVHVPLIIFWEILVLIAFLLWLYEWSNLWWAVVFFVIFLCLYYGSLFYTKYKYKTEEEWVWMWDLIISPYLWVLLYMWISSSSMYIEELFCSVLIFFILTSIFGLIVYLIQNVLLGKRADFLTDEMAEKSLPLVPSMVLSLVVVIIWHEAIFNTLVNFWDSFFEQMMNNSL